MLAWDLTGCPDRDAPWVGIYLFELDLVRGLRHSILIEYQKTGAGGPLVYRAYEPLAPLLSHYSCGANGGARSH